MAFDSCAAAPLLTRAVAVSLACAYICDAGANINICDGDVKKLYVFNY